MNRNHFSIYAIVPNLALLAFIHSLPAAATCTSPDLSLTFLAPSPSFVAYTVEPKTVRVEPCGLWWTTDVSVTFSTNEPALALYDDGRHDDGADNDGVYGGTWRPSTVGPVTLTTTATDPYKPNNIVTTSVSGEVRPRFYSIETVPFQWIDATVGVRQPRQQIWPPITIPAIPIGFDFTYYGRSYNSLAFIEAGALVIGRNWDVPSYTTSLPDPAEPNNLIAPFWDYRLSPQWDTGAVFTLLDGSAPNRRFTISWIDITYGDQCGDVCIPTGTGSFQVTLYEGSNDIVFRYLDIDFDYLMGNFFTIGVENSDATQATVQYSYKEFSNAQPGVSSRTALRFFVTPVNQPPSANAGPDRVVNEGETTALPGSGADPDGTISSYVWTQIAGPTVSLANANSATASFVAPQVTGDTVLTFRLTVTDDRGATATDTASITVRNVANNPPTANAGADQTAKQKTTVTLNGSGSSDSDGRIVSYRWRQVDGKGVTLKNAASANATFTAPSTNTPIKLTFELTVADNSGATAKDQVVVVVKR